MKKGQSANSGGRDSVIANDFGLKVFGRKKILWKFLLCVMAVMVVPIVLAGSTYARTVTSVEETIVNKVLAQGVYRCYDGGFIVSDFNPIAESYSGISSFINKNKDQNEWDVPLINGLNASSLASSAKYRLGTSGSLSCKDFFVGNFGNSDILTVTGHTVPSLLQPNDVAQLLEDMGYVIGNVNDSGNADPCYSLKYTYEIGGKTVTKNTNQVCQDGNGNLRVEGAVGSVGNTSSEKAWFGLDESSNFAQKNQICLFVVNADNTWQRGCRTLANGEVFDGGWLLGLVSGACGNGSTCNAEEGDALSGYSIYTIDFVSSGNGGVMESESLSSKKASFINGSGSDAGAQAVKYLFGITATDLYLSRAETRFLYQDYLTTYYSVGIDCDSSKAEFYTNQDRSLYRGPIWWYDKSSKSMKQCYCLLSGAKNKNNAVNGLSGGWMQYNKISDLNALLEIFEVDELGHEYSESELEELGSLASEGDYQNNLNSDSGEDLCLEGSGALGWIICPVVKGVAAVGEYMWEQIETHHLKISVGEIFESSSGVATAWGIVRNIANSIFIILFLIVIFSQLTGVGIDNYGIKRILPKLIVVAILVNLSYIICELAIDLSNILGVGLNDLLANAAGNVDIGAPADIASQATGGVAVLGLVGGGAWLYALLNPLGVVALGLAVLGIVITIVVSMLVLYLVLVIREAGIILAVVVSPVAIVCYMLPNTEKFYKKWLDIFKALLVVYPICGALIGAGKLAGAVLASINTPSMKVAAMLVQVIPFFLIPSLLKNSLSLMGNIGTKLSGWGRSLGRRGSSAAQNAIKGTKAVQDYAKYNQERRSIARAERIRNRMNRRMARGLSADDRKKWQSLTRKISSGEGLSAEDSAEYDRLKKLTGNGGLSEFQRRRLSEANAVIRESALNREKAQYGADDSVLAGQIESDRYTNQRAAEEARDWNQRFFRDNEGNVWTSDGNGHYETVDRHGVRHMEDAENILAMARNGQGQMVSRREATLSRDEIGRARQTGQLAGYAANTNAVGAASRGARLSSGVASQAEMIKDIQSGQDGVLQIQQDEVIAKGRELAGKAEARATLTESPVAATDVYIRRATNDYNLAQAGNRIEVTPEITVEYAQSLATQRFNTSQERMYSEQLVNNSRAQSLADLAGAIGGANFDPHGDGSLIGSGNGGGHERDINYIMAAIKDVVAKGGIEDLNNLIKNAGPQISSDSRVARAVGGYMATMSMEPAMKAYGKSIANLPEGSIIPSYKHWLNAVDNPTGDPDGKLSLAGFIRANGNTVLANASKDTFKFYEADPALISKFSPSQILVGALSAKDNETRNAANKMLTERLKGVSSGDLDAALDSISASEWAHMEDSTFAALVGLPRNPDGTYGAISSDMLPRLEAAKDKLRRAGGTVVANMRPEVRKYLYPYDNNGGGTT